MSPSTGAGLCRITIAAPQRRIDLSMPADIPLIQMMPTLLRVAGADLADAGLAHSGWMLQQLDGPPLDNNLSLAQIGVRDGEVLYFRPRLSLIPEMAYDDVADVVATGVNERSDRWRIETTRRFGLVTGAILLLTGLLPILLYGPPWRVPAVAADAAALFAVVMAVALSRAVGDSVGGAVLGYVALPYAFVAGLLAPAKEHLALADVGAPHLLAACAATALVAIVAGFGVADGLPSFLGIAVAGLIGVIGAAVAIAMPGTEPAGIAAAAIALVLALAGLVPSLSFRLGRVPLPPIPTNAEELRSEATVVDGKALLKRTVVADRFATGLVTGIALTVLGGLLFLVMDSGWPGPTMALVVGVSMLLRGRIFRGRVQRTWLLGVGLFALVALGLALSLRAEPKTALVLVLPGAIIIGAIILWAAMWLPGHRLSPFWGRAGDIFDMLVVISLAPLVLAVLRLYSKVRGLSG